MIKINYRKCRRSDLLPASRLIKAAMDHLRKKTGKLPVPWRARGIPPFFDHLLKSDPDTFYCAWKGDRLVGFAGACIRGRQWYLAWLFVHPTVQNRGVGKKLLEKVWRDKPGMVHSLCTFAFNMHAVGLYSKFGMAPLADLPWMKADPAKLRNLKPSKLKVIDTHTREDIKWVNNLEMRIRGYSHAREWQFWSKSEIHKLYLFRDNGKRVAYGLIANNALIAPIGVVDEKYIIDAATALIRLTKPPGNEKTALWCPTSNIKLYQYLISTGFRAEEMEIFMSDKPYPDWQRYVPATLSVL